MSRSFTAAERAAIASLRSGHHSKWECQDADGVYRDYTQYLRTDWFTGATIEEGIDRDTISLRATLLRETGTLSLSPFRSDSLVNRNGAGNYATAIDLWRKWKLSVAVMREGYPPTGSDWKELVQGRIDVIEWSGDQIFVTGRGEEAVLLDYWIATERQYGSAGGIAMETTLQSMWDQNLNAIAPTLYTPTSPGYLMNVWTQLKGNLFPASKEVAQKAGAVIRYRHDSSDVYRPTLLIPDRTAIPGDEVFTFGASEYTNLTQVKIDKQGIRNFVKLKYAHSTLGVQTVIYPHMAGTGTVACTAGAATFSSSQAGILQNGAEIIVAGIAYTVSAFNGTTGATLLAQAISLGTPTFTASAFTAHGTLSGDGTTESIDRFGRNDIEFDLGVDTQVNDATKAQAMTDTIGLDMEFSDLDQTFETLGAWPVQMYDYVKLEACVQYDEPQYGGVTYIRHDIADATIKSTVGLSGKPKGAYRGWKALSERLAGDPTAQTVIPLICRVKVQTTTPTQVVFRVAVADPYPLADITIVFTGVGVGTISPASPQTILRANVTSNIDTTGTVDITVARAAFGTGTGRITFTATSPTRTASTDSGEVPALDRDTVELLCRAKLQTTSATQVVFRVAVSDPVSGGSGNVTLVYTGVGVGTIAPASPQTILSANVTSDIDTTGTVDVTVDRAAFGTGTGRITFTATRTGRVPSTDSGDVPAQDRDTVYTECKATVSAVSATTVTVTVTGVVVSGTPTVGYVGVTGTATLNAGHAAGTYTYAQNGTDNVWVFNRGAFGTGPGQAQFRSITAGAESDDDFVEIPEQGRDTIALLMRAKVQSTTATQVVVRVALSDPVAQSGINGSIAYEGGSVSPTSPQSVASAGITTDIDTTGYVDFTITRPLFKAGTDRVTFTGTRANRTSDSDAVDVPEQVQAGSITPTETQARNRCGLKHSTSQVTTSATVLNLAWDSESYDSNALHNTTTNNSRITIPSGGNVGVWFFGGQVTFEDNGSGGRRLAIVKNNDLVSIAEVALAAHPAGYPTICHVAISVDAPAVGDYFELRATQNSGGNLNVGGGSASWFSATHLW